MKEIHEGLTGNGVKCFLVVTVDALSGRWIHTETFGTLAEAKSWKKYA